MYKLSPYQNQPTENWQPITEKLIEKHPLKMQELAEVVLESWEEIFRSRIGKKPFLIGKDIFPQPQIMGYLLHELIPLELSRRYPQYWRKDFTSKEKDLIYLPDDSFSIEIKTSSNPKNIFGNRSYAQKGETEKKDKSGYYLAINFEKFDKSTFQPKILLIRFGWIDHDDWSGQKASTGQQSRLSKYVEMYKLLQLYPKTERLALTFL